MKMWKGTFATIGAFMVLAGALAPAAEKYGKPNSIVHVVTLYFKPDATEEQKKAVIDGVEKMAAEIPGIKNVWLRSVKVQGEYLEKGQEKPTRFTHAFVMEFESQEAFEKYADHPAHRKWEEIYLPVRGRSWTHDITN